MVEKLLCNSVSLKRCHIFPSIVDANLKSILDKAYHFIMHMKLIVIVLTCHGEYSYFWVSGFYMSYMSSMSVSFYEALLLLFYR